MARCSTSLVALLSLVALTACTAESADEKPGAERWTPGKGEGAFEIVERGPLPNVPVAVDLTGYAPAYRVESYGGTALAIDLRALDGADPFLVIEGPIDQDGAAPGAGRVFAQDDDGGAGYDSRLAVVLDEPGVYRVLAGTYDAFGLGLAPAGSLQLDARCTAACSRRAIDQKTFLAGLRDAGQLDALLAGADAELAAMIPDPALRAELIAQLRAIAAAQDFAGVERFPTIPLGAIGQLRPAIGLIDAPAPAPDAVLDGELRALLGDCMVERDGPSPLHPALPGVGYGHFPDLALTGCQVAHSRALAQILTSLAAGNGSVVRWQGAELRTPLALIEALVASGHVIETRNERTYANFISLTYGDVDVRWPAWLDTGIDLESGERLVVPMGHSHRAWRITGPVVNARVMFYLGIDGAAFFAQTQTRPAWTGDVASYTSTDPADALATVDVAATYLRRVRVERATVAAGLPADGYGFLGVCNDSNAAIELATRGTVTTFPLMRAAELDAAADLGDGLDDLLRALPHDADAIASRADALRRVLAMTPHALDAASLWDDVLRRQLVAARGEL